MRVFISTLGCKINEVDSELYAQELRNLGAEVVDAMQDADAVIINSCCVTNRAQAQSLQAARRAVRNNPGKPVYLTGCSSALLSLTHRPVPDGVSVIAMQDRAAVARRVMGEEAAPGEAEGAWIVQQIGHASRRNRVDVRVQEGCDNMCTYCVVPFVRGTRLLSKPCSAVIQEVVGLGRSGVKEVVLTGTEIGKYDDGSTRLAGLLAGLVSALQAAGLPTRIRLSSINPDGVTPALEELFRAYPQVLCPQLHIPLQSGSDVILRHMRRPYQLRDLQDLADRLRAVNPLFTLTTDIITGFPGEGEPEFQATLEAIQHIQFAKVHAFPYSPRPFTPAARDEQQVPPHVARERVHRVLDAAERSGTAFAQCFVGQTVTIVSEQSVPGAVAGYSEFYLWTQAHVPGGAVLEHDRLVDVVIEKIGFKEGRVVLSGKTQL